MVVTTGKGGGEWLLGQGEGDGIGQREGYMEGGCYAGGRRWRVVVRQEGDTSGLLLVRGKMLDGG
jgi:hypothetical protein